MSEESPYYHHPVQLRPFEPCCIIAGWCRKCEAVVCWGHHLNVEALIAIGVLRHVKKEIKHNDLVSDPITRKHDEEDNGQGN